MEFSISGTRAIGYEEDKRELSPSRIKSRCFKSLCVKNETIKTRGEILDDSFDVGLGEVSRSTMPKAEIREIHSSL